MADSDRVTFSRRTAGQLEEMWRWFKRQPHNRQPRPGTVNQRASGPHLCKWTGAGTWLKGTKQTLEIYTGTPGEEEPSGITEDVFNKFGDIPSDSWVWIQNNGFGFYAASAEC